MKKPTATTSWKLYLETEIPAIESIIRNHGYSLSENQPHTKGERFLMQAVTTTGGKKVILFGSNKLGEKVVIKATKDETGKQELKHEKKRRELLHDLDFSYTPFNSPVELEFIEQSGFIISIQKYIKQDSTFLERPIEEQFNYSLQAFKTQEGVRATTHKHIRTIKRVFGNRNSNDYKKLFSHFTEFISLNSPDPETVKVTQSTKTYLEKNLLRIEQYCGFLTHTDFVPHNFRINNNVMYLLDFSSLQFGNKHEGWGRFLNFMTLYNPELETLLINYVEDNRAPEERESLQLMRIFRLGEIITYYTKTLSRSQGDLLDLNNLRIKFWTDVLKAELQNKRVAKEIVLQYQEHRNNLRSDEENQRQVGLH